MTTPPAPRAPVMAKVCGLSTAEAVAAATDGGPAGMGAGFVGFITFPKSPRHLEPADIRPLALQARRAGASVVSVLVDPDDGQINRVMNSFAPDFIQLHGHESPDRVRAISNSGIAVIKAFGIASAADLDATRAYGNGVAMFLFDAKPPPSAEVPGGRGVSFDWSLLADYAGPVPWLLSGGLDSTNVADAVARTGARMVDVSSGVESAPGVKDTAAITRFLAALNA